MNIKNVHRLLLLALSAILLAIAIIGTRQYIFSTGVHALKAHNYGTAMDCFYPLATLGDDHSQYMVGQFYAYGWGVPKDRIKALYWFRRARMWADDVQDPGSVAAYYVGEGYANGIGVDRDIREAKEWFKIAEDGGYREKSGGSRH